MNKKRQAEVESVLFRSVVGYAPYPGVDPYPTKEEFEKVGKKMYKDLPMKVRTLDDGTKCKYFGKSRTHSGAHQYDAYICEDGKLVSY